MRFNNKLQFIILYYSIIYIYMYQICIVIYYNVVI